MPCSIRIRVLDGGFGGLGFWSFGCVAGLKFRGMGFERNYDRVTGWNRLERQKMIKRMLLVI